MAGLPKKGKGFLQPAFMGDRYQHATEVSIVEAQCTGIGEAPANRR